MNRRRFLKASTLASAATLPSLGREEENRLVPIWVARNDQLIDEILPQQQRDKSKPHFGGFGGTYDLFPVGKASWFCNRLTIGLIHPKSKHFQSDQVAETAKLAMEFINSLQHPDGTIDLTSTNFHSTPDLGFVVEPNALTQSLLRRFAPDQHPELQQANEDFLQLAGKALTVGGIHTPNHRWVVCMALSWINHLFPDEKLVSRLNQWLYEKIDIDSEGQYTERSSSIYSPIVNKCLITIARLAKRPGLLDPVRRNLDLNKYLVRPNGEIVTDVSRRQDQFKVAKMGNHYYPYRYMAIADSNGEYAAFANQIANDTGEENLVGNLAYFLDDSSLQKTLPPDKPLPDTYTRLFPVSKVVRVRQKSLDATILADNEAFLTFQNHNAALRAVRLASAFFGKGQFNSPTLKQVNDSTFQLNQTLNAHYYQPMPVNLLPGDGNWHKMPRNKRPKSEAQILRSQITVSLVDSGLALDFQIEGTDRVPLAIEFAFDTAGTLDGVREIEEIENAFLPADDSVFYSMGDQKIKLTHCRAVHRWTQIRGGLPKLDAKCVYVTDFTPFRCRILIQAS